MSDVHRWIRTGHFSVPLVLPQCGEETADQRLNFSNSWLRLYIQAPSRESRTWKSRRQAVGGQGCLLYFHGERTGRNTWPCFQATETDCLPRSGCFYFSLPALRYRSIIVEENREKSNRDRGCFGEGRNLRNPATSAAANSTNDVIAKK